MCTVRFIHIKSITCIAQYHLYCIVIFYTASQEQDTLLLPITPPNMDKFSQNLSPADFKSAII